MKFERRLVAAMHRYAVLDDQPLTPVLARLLVAVSHDGVVGDVDLRTAVRTLDRSHSPSPLKKYN